MDKKLGLFLVLVGLFAFSWFLGGSVESASTNNNSYSGSPVTGKALDVYFFYGQGCPHCANVEPFLSEMAKKYCLQMHSYDVYSNRSCLSLFDEYSDEYGLSQDSRAVPTVFVSGTYFTGDTPILNSFEQAVIDAEQKISLTDQTKTAEGSGSNQTMSKGSSSVPASEGASNAYSLSLMVTALAALVGAFNPCSIGVLVFLIGARVLVRDQSKRALKVGLTFCFSVFLAYLLFGLGLLTFVQSNGFSSVFSLMVTSFAVLVGVFYLKDVFWYGRGGFTMEVPRSLKPSLTKLLKGVTSPLGAFALGFLVAGFELPCSGGPFLFILGQLANNATRLQAVPLLLFYNLVSVLPLIMISLLLYSNVFSVGKIREWGEKNKRLMRFFGGCLMISLGILDAPATQVLELFQLSMQYIKVAVPPFLVVMLLYFFVSFAKRNKFVSKLKGPLGRAILLIFLSAALVFTIPASKDFSVYAQSHATMTSLTLGISAPVQFPFPDDAVRCPGQVSPVLGTFSIAGGSLQYSADIYVKVYGKYKGESIWNFLGRYVLPQNNYITFTSTWAAYFTLPTPPEGESTFQVRVLGAAVPYGTPLANIVSLSPQGVPSGAQQDVQVSYDVLAIKEIKIEGKTDPKNPVTGEDVKYTAVLTDSTNANLGIYSTGLTSEVTWEVEPTGTRKTMSPLGGGGAIETRRGNDNPWTDGASNSGPPPIDTHGEKKVKVTVRWNNNSGNEICSVEGEKTYNLFFRKDAKDYKTQNAPNWFYYWSVHDDSAVSTRGFDYTDTKNYRYGAVGPTTWASTNIKTGLTTLTDQASKGCGLIAENGADAPTFQLPSVNLYVNHKGSDCLAMVIGHEKTHVDIYNNWQPGGIWYSSTDSDCDLIPDDVEKQWGLNPNTADTDPAYSAYGTGIPAYAHVTRSGTKNCIVPANLPRLDQDEEIYCDLVGGSMQRANSASDWANPGKKSQPQYMRVAMETGTNATFNGAFAEQGKDTDGDGLYDFLTIEAGVYVASAGTYSLAGNLVDSQGNLISTAENDTFQLIPGSQLFDLNFDGVSIRTSRTNGPYMLRDIYLLDNGTGDYLDHPLNTPAYNFKQFEQPPAELTGNFSESTVDANGTSLFDSLDVSVGMDVKEAGFYTVVADLNLNAKGTLAAANSSFLNTGVQNVILSFDGQAIRAYRTDGPYSLKTVEVQDQNYNQTDIVDDAYNTSAYLYTQFERPEAEFTGKFANFGVDTDSNGLFNVLKIQAEVDAEKGGNYIFSTDLSDIHDGEITANSTQVLLNAGTQNVTLDLDGAAIGDNGVDGPYVLTSLELFNSSGGSLSAEPYYHNTSTYSFSQFERAGVITGRVLAQDGNAVQNVQVYLDDVNDIFLSSTFTDSNGNYSFKGLETGTYQLSAVVSVPTFDMDATNASVTKGQTTEVNFTLALIPEFPSHLVIPLFMVATVVAAIAYRKKWSKLQNSKLNRERG